ncbi:MAG: hypothetical protein RR585_12045 [Coprobacillus sp.]
MMNLKKKEKSFDIFYENSVKAKALTEEQYQFFNETLRYVFQHQKDVVKANVIVEAIIEQLLSEKENKNLLKRNIKDYVAKIEKTIRIKEKVMEIKKQDQEKYIISGLWQTMCAYIVVLFIKEFLTQHYLISFSVDVLVAIVAFYITIHNIMRQFKIIKRHQLSIKPFSMNMIGLAVAIFITVMTLTSPFDISFVILVISYLTHKKMFDKELNV